jgi:hypothetical protein
VEVDLENAENDKAHEKQLFVLRTRLSACRSRQELAKSLREDIRTSLQENIENEYGDQLIYSDETSGRLTVDIDSLDYWATSRYGISINSRHMNFPLADREEQKTWNDLTVYIRDDARIGYKIGTGSEHMARKTQR